MAKLPADMQMHNLLTACERYLRDACKRGPEHVKQIAKTATYQMMVCAVLEAGGEVPLCSPAKNSNDNLVPVLNLIKVEDL